MLADIARTRAEPVLRTRTRATGLDLRRLDKDNVQTGHEPVPRPSQSSFTSWHKVVLGMQAKPNPCPSLPEPVPAHIARRHPVFEKGGLLPGVLPCKLPEYSRSVRMTSSKSCKQRWAKNVSQTLAAAGSVRAMPLRTRAEAGKAFQNEGC